MSYNNTPITQVKQPPKTQLQIEKQVEQCSKGNDPKQKPLLSEKKEPLQNSYRHNYDGIIITDVWSDNLEEEMQKIIQVVEKYPYVAMDTEFPGVVVRPTGNFRTPSEYNYRMLQNNVNLLKIIQLGLSFSDQSGCLPKEGHCTWQFHFKFNLKKDLYAHDSIELLTNSGIDFKKHEEKGIDVQHFGELLTSSGIVLNDEVRWISFHGAYDFGYLIKLLTNNDLPETELEFFNLAHTYFPNLYDIKYLMKSVESLRGGLSQLADDLKVARIGPAHQAGSDSLLTLHSFFKMMMIFFENKFDDEKYLGILYGLGPGAVDEKQAMFSFSASSPPPQYSSFSPQSNGVSVNDSEHNHQQQLLLNSHYYSPTPNGSFYPGLAS